MIPSALNYHKAGSVEEALDLLEKYGDEAKILAGGHSLIPVLKLRLNDTEHLIDISKIAALKQIKEEGGNIIIGAGATHGDIVKSDLIKSKIPMLSEGADLIGDIQVRNFGTLGGSLAHADPAADWPAMMLAANASMHLQGKNGKREIKADDFFMGLFTTDLAEDEILVAISIPVPPAGTKNTYVKFMQPASRFAIVGCAAMITRTNGKCENVRLAFSGTSAKPYRAKAAEAALEGADYNESNIAAAVAKVTDGVSVLSDHYATQAYRTHLAKVFARRALQALS
jgi:carbon-monoxide dehydrogenase medium subunit